MRAPVFVFLAWTVGCVPQPVDAAHFSCDDSVIPLGPDEEGRAEITPRVLQNPILFSRVVPSTSRSGSVARSSCSPTRSWT